MAKLHCHSHRPTCTAFSSLRQNLMLLWGENSEPQLVIQFIM